MESHSASDRSEVAETCAVAVDLAQKFTWLYHNQIDICVSQQTQVYQQQSIQDMEAETINVEAVVDRIADIFDSLMVAEHVIQSIWLSSHTMVI